MKIITVRKLDGLPCSSCEEIIPVGEECFQYYNSVSHSLKFNLHWRHLLCAYNFKPRKQSFDEYVDYYRGIRKKKKVIKSNSMIQCSLCKNSSKVFLNFYALSQHLKDKHCIIR